MPTNKSQSLIYQSYGMLHVDGTLMCFCNEKRANWYVNRGLANWVTEDRFQLNFIPNGHGKSKDPYYTQSMENRCVVCGSLENLNKHHVVPYVFRSRFPIQYKESNHHNVLATCIHCHEEYEDCANDFKALLAKNVGASINTHISAEQKDNKKIISARNFIQKYTNGELLTKEGKIIPIPEEKLNYLKEVSEKPLKECEPVNGSAWADKIMEDVLSKNALQDFIKNWRKHFLDNAKPKFLPQFWSVDHKLENKSLG